MTRLKVNPSLMRFKKFENKFGLLRLSRRLHKRWVVLLAYSKALQLVGFVLEDHVGFPLGISL